MKKRLIFTLALLLAFCASKLQAAPFQEDKIFNGLYAWFPLDGNAEDIGPKGIGGMVNANGPTPTTDRLGQANSAYHFDGKDDYIFLNLDINPSKIPQMSVAFWFKYEKKPAVLFCHDNGGFDRCVTLEILPQIIGLTALAGPQKQFIGGFLPSSNQWYMAIATWDATKGEASLYTKTSKFEATTVQNARTGEGWDFTLLGKGPSYGSPLQGSLDNVVVWGRVLSANEAKRLLEHPEILDHASRLKVSKELAEAKKLFQAGFFKAGVQTYKNALDQAGEKLGHIDTTQMLYTMKGVPLSFQGEVFLSHHQSLLSDEKITNLAAFLTDAPKGVQVKTVLNAPSAEKNWIHQGDIITHLNGHPVKTRAEVSAFIKNMSPGTTVTATVLRQGAAHQTHASIVAGQKNKRLTGWAIYRLMDYGMLAAYAGHPAQTRAAAKAIIAIQKKFPTDLKPSFYKEAATVLNALAAAMEKNPEAGYQILLDAGKLSSLTNFYPTSYSKYFAPLYANPKKLAYLLNTDVSKLPKVAPFPSQKQAYITLNSKITAGVKSVANKNKPASTQPAGGQPASTQDQGTVTSKGIFLN